MRRTSPVVYILALSVVLLGMLCVPAAFAATPQIAAGAAHVVALKSDGTVWAWGGNASGQLGNNTTTASSVPVKVSNLTNVTMVAAGGDHSVALDATGKVWTWGSDAWGELGNDAAFVNWSVPVAVPIPNLPTGVTAVSVAAGTNFTVVALSDGTVYAWGENTYGQLGANPGTTPYSATPLKVTGIASASRVAAGISHALALLNDGTVVSWGYNQYGQLGVSNLANSSTPVSVTGLTGVTAIAAGGNTSAAVGSGGKVYTWGDNTFGQLGVPVATSSRSTIAEVSGVTAGAGTYVLAVGNGHIAMVTAAGGVTSWGGNERGQLGNGTKIDSSTPVNAAGLSASVLQVAASNNFTVALKSDGTVLCWGDNFSGQLGNGTSSTGRVTPTVVSGVPKILTAASGQTHTVAVTTQGYVYSWGTNTRGQLGDGTTTDSQKPIKLDENALHKAKAVAVGRLHTAVVANGGKVFVWGDNSAGQLGVDLVTTSYRSTPAEVSLGVTVTAVAAGNDHTVALASNGDVYAWGDNTFGQIGGTQVNSYTPIVVLTGVKAIAAAGFHTVALKSDGTVWYWGKRNNDTNDFDATPVQMSGLTGSYTAIAAGSYHTLALRSDGTVWGWGNNYTGELGNNTVSTTATMTPVQVKVSGTANLTSIAAIAAGTGHSLAIASNPLSGTVVYGWGNNVDKQLGSTTAPADYSTVAKNLGSAMKTYTSVSASDSSLAVLNGDLLTWGANSYGQLNGELFSTPQPAVVNLITPNPAVTLTATYGGSPGSPIAPATVNLSAVAAADSGKTVSKVDFYDGNSTIIATVNAAPYTYWWMEGLTAGTYSFTARVTDSNNDNATSTPVTVTVAAANQSPTVTLTSPNAGATLGQGTITLTASASDSDGTIKEVEFYAGTNLLGTVTAPSTGTTYSYDWTGMAKGSYILTAVAYDNNWAPATSVPVAIVVGQPTPTISSVSPTSVYNGVPTEVTINGANMDSATVSFDKGTVAIKPPASATKIVATVTGSSTGSGTLTVTNPGGSATKSLTVNARLNPVITWNPAPLYVGSKLGAAQLNATANVSGTFAYTPIADTPMNTVGPQTLSATFTPYDSKYATVTTTAVVTVNAKLVPVITWTTPQAITYGTPLSGTQLNAQASPDGGSFSYNPLPGAMLTAGTHTLSVTYTPVQADQATYGTATASVSLVVNKAAATITLDQGTLSKTYDGAPKAVTATTNPVGLPYSVTYNGSPTAPTAAGSYAVVATITDDNYTGSVTGTLTIAKATPTITWTPGTPFYVGSKLSAAQLNAVASFSGTSLSGSFTYAPALDTVLNSIGTQTLSVSFIPTDPNYASVSASASLPVIAKLVPTITWADPSAIDYGTALGTQLNATATYNSSTVPGTMTYTPASGTVLNAGVQTLSVTFVPNDSVTYATVSKSVQLTVTKATTVLTWAKPADIVTGTPLTLKQLNASTSVPGTYVYNPPQGAVLAAGDHVLTVTFTPDNLVNYTTASATTNLTVTRANVALAGLGATASASATDQASTTAALNDGKPETVWKGSGTSSQSAQIDFNTPQTIDEIRIIGDGSTVLNDYTVEYWNGATWQLAVSAVTGNPSVDIGTINLSPAVTTAKIRVTVTTVNGNAVSDTNQAAIAEIEAYTVGATPNTPPTVTLTTSADASGIVTAPADLTLTATPADTDSTSPAKDIVKVDFYSGSEKLHSVNSPGPYTYTWKNVLGGTYNIVAVVTDGLGAVGTATRSVIVNRPPVVNVTAPGNNSAFVAPANITLSAVASDNDGFVGKVEFFNGGNSLGTVTAAPYSITWNNVSANNAYTVTAKATDNYGAESVSSPVNIAVYDAPTVTLTIDNGPIYSTPASVSMTAAAAAANGGTITRVDFYNGNSLLASKTTGFTYTWPVSTYGTFALTAVATDNHGNSTTSQAVTITVNAQPTVSLTTPASGAVFTGPATIALKALASDPDGTIARVVFSVNGSPVATVTTTPTAGTYDYTMSGVTAGSYTITAVAYDNLGALSTSASSTVSVTNAAPSVLITSPASGATFTGSGTSVTLQATAADPDGSVASVKFYRRGTTDPLVTVTSAPFTFTATGLAVGTHTFYAVATDNLGATATSPDVTVTVVAPVRTNVALAANGGVVTVSSAINQTLYPASSLINGDRYAFVSGAATWGKGGGWNDATNNFYPDWVQINFSGQKTIDQVDVYGLQDNFAAPATNFDASTGTIPTCTKYCVSEFVVQYWDGFSWQQAAAPITGNNKVLRSVTFTPVSTDRIRVQINNAIGGYSRLVEVEAWSSTGAPVNLPPTVALTAPADGSTAGNAPASITLTATASDPDGTVSKVEFYSGANLLATTTSSPYSYTWTNVEAGTYSIIAIATDDLGAITSSAPVSVTVSPKPNASPTVDTFTAVPAGTAPATVTLTATATDTDGSITKVEFYNGGAQLAIVTAAPYTFSWSGVPAGTYTITAVATDNQGANGTRTAMFTVAPTPNQNPSVTLLAPPDGSSFVAPAAINLAALASDTDGTVARVEFFSGDTKLTTVTTAPYTFTHTGVTPGTYTYKAVATDNAGGTATSATATITVTNTPPVVSLTSPVNAATYVAPATIELSAFAFDANGTITKVEFLDGDTLVGTVTAPPFAVTLTGVAAGSHTYTARVTDNDGALTTSSAATITVSARSNVALATNGATATASTVNGSNLADAVNNGDRTGTAYWQDNTANDFTNDWIEVAFSASQTIDEIDVYTLQDRPGDALSGPTQTFTTNGITDFLVQYWDGTTWINIPGGIILGNDLVLNTFTFTPITTTKIRVKVNGAASSFSQIAEIEAYNSVGGSVNNPPNVTVSSPANGASYTAPVDLTLTATATDTDGTVTSVAFYDGASPLCTDTHDSGTSTTYSCTVQNFSAKTYSIYAKATDDKGAVATSMMNTVIVQPKPNVPPTISFTAPLMGQVFEAKSTLVQTADVTVTYNAADSDGTINTVKLFNGVTELTSVTDKGASYIGSYALNGLGIGSYTLTAVVTDDQGATTSTSVTFTVAPHVNVAPTVTSFDATPVSGLAPTTVNLSATASDTDGNVTTISFYNGNALLATVSPTTAAGTFTASYSWLNVEPGTYTVRAISLDNSSAISSAVTQTVTVENRAPNSFTVVANSTTPGSLYTYDTLTLTAVGVTDFETNGSIAKVEFYTSGGALLGTGTKSGNDYSISWTTAVAGEHSFTVKAFDNYGAVTTATLTITVTRQNVALSSFGSVASAVTANSGADPALINNGTRDSSDPSKAWIDKTKNQYPDYVMIDFGTPRTISEIDIVSLRSPGATGSITATETTTEGMSAFALYYCPTNATCTLEAPTVGWVFIPGSYITNNKLVVKPVNFTAITTSKIRVKGMAGTSATLNTAGFTRLVEVEAYR